MRNLRDSISGFINDEIHTHTQDLTRPKISKLAWEKIHDEMYAEVDTITYNMVFIPIKTIIEINHEKTHS